MLVFLYAIMLMTVGDGHYGRFADFRCAHKLNWATLRKRTLGAATQYFRPASVANDGCAAIATGQRNT
jgi:hypothetical protein